jgi:hypothetical protein
MPHNFNGRFWNASGLRADFVPRLLNDNHKLQQIFICENLLQRPNDENRLKNAITDDERWVSGYDTETKQRSPHWEEFRFASSQENATVASASETSAA